MKGEVESRRVLEEERAPHSVRTTADDDQRRCEAQDLEVLAEFLRVPDLAVFGFQGFTAARLSVDLGLHFATHGFASGMVFSCVVLSLFFKPHRRLDDRVPLAAAARDSSAVTASSNGSDKYDVLQPGHRPPSFLPAPAAMRLCDRLRSSRWSQARKP